MSINKTIMRYAKLYEEVYNTAAPKVTVSNGKGWATVGGKSAREFELKREIVEMEKIIIRRMADHLIQFDEEVIQVLEETIQAVRNHEYSYASNVLLKAVSVINNAAQLSNEKRVREQIEFNPQSIKY